MNAAPHALLNALAPEEARAALARCCGSARWVAGMLARRPFGSDDDLHAAGDAVWTTLGRDDFLEAFAAHPKIGERTGGAWSAQEQAQAASSASADDAAALRALNETYAARFGYIFIICATGKSTAEILAALRARLPNDPDAELAVAAAEQARITHLRLEKLAR